MKKSTPAFKISHMLALTALVVLGTFWYLTNTSLKEVNARVEFFRTELGGYSPVQDKIYNARQLALQMDKQKSMFADESKTSHLADRIYEGLTKEELVYVKSKYLDIFLEADEAYLESGLTSQTWEYLRSEVATLAEENRGAWLEELDRLDERTKVVFARSLTLEITNALTPYLTLGKHDNLPELEGFEESMGELTQRARATIESVTKSQKAPAEQQGQA